MEAPEEEAAKTGSKGSVKKCGNKALEAGAALSGSEKKQRDKNKQKDNWRDSPRAPMRMRVESMKNGSTRKEKKKNFPFFF